jgi:hypothetical protein
MDNYPIIVHNLFKKACNVLKITGFSFRVMRRQVPINTKKSFRVGYINLRTKVICLDIYTPKKREPKSINGLLRVFAHEFAHYQKPPFRQFYKRKWIARSHYPEFYQQVTRNVEEFKQDRELSQFFVQ